MLRAIEVGTYWGVLILVGGLEEFPESVIKGIVSFSTM